jgi:16S rRNA processing protein RimM
MTLYAEALASSWNSGDDLSSGSYQEPPETLWVHEMVGALVVDSSGGSRGHVVSVVENPASDLLELDNGNLVPLRFVSGTLVREDGSRVLQVEAPEGLLD